MDVMKDVDVATAADADQETVFLETAHAVVFSGSSFCCVCAEIMDVVMVVDAAMIPAGSLSCFCSCAEDAEIIAAAADFSGGRGRG